ncbi:MAG: NUDIX domain-containing protein [Candidatus Micrarchaeia archaeon]
MSEFNVTVVGFVHTRGKLLICKRAETKKFLPGYWELPGGHVEEGEIPQDALRRELKEELGIDSTVLNPFDCFSYSSHKGASIEIAFFVTVEKPASIAPVNREDVAEVRWVNEKELDLFKISEQEKAVMKTGFRLLH